MVQVMDRPGLEDPFFDFVKKLPAEDVFSGKKKSQLLESSSFCGILVVRVLGKCVKTGLSAAYERWCLFCQKTEKTI